MKKFLLNSALIVVSVLIAYGLIELLVRVALPYLSPAILNNQCRELRTLGQTSKKFTTPQVPYIAIVGDSYGAGQGDWFADNRYNLNSRYHAAHVVQDMTGTDVISLSKAGAGNYDGAAVFAVNTYRYLKDSGFNLEPPEAIVVYFYEGNDVSDNLRFMERYFVPDFDAGKLFDDEVFASFAVEIDQRHSRGVLPRIQDKFIVGNMVSRAIEGMVYAATKKAEPLPPGKQFNALIDTKEVWLPDSIEVDVSLWKGDDLRNGVRFFERALHRVSEVWPDSRKFVVYLPSPLTTYSFLDEAASKRLEASRMLEGMVKDAAERNCYVFIDFSDRIREVAKSKLLHGPKDWNHFNRAGYELLGDAIVNAVSN